MTLFKNIAFFIFLYCGYVPLRDFILARRGRSRAVVVYYHRIGGRDVLTKPTDEFRRDLDYLKRRYDCITLGELCRRLRTNAPLKRRVAVVTFDDGYRDNYTQAVPQLLAAGVPATFFISTGFIGTDRVFPHDARDKKSPAANPAAHPKLTWDDLRAMQSAGFEIGSHTINHINLGQADEPTIRNELNESLAAINHELGVRPRTFSFPWGKPGDFSESAIQAAREAGYSSAALAYGGVNRRGDDPFRIQRVDVGNGYLTPLAVRARIAGFDPDYLRNSSRLKLK